MAAAERTFRNADAVEVTVFLTDFAAFALVRNGLVLVEPGQEEVEALPNYELTPTTPGLSIPAHDYIANTYTDGKLTTVVYKKGGVAGMTVATLTMVYAGDNLVSVTREPTINDLES
jgi:hypothetical protein